ALMQNLLPSCMGGPTMALTWLRPEEVVIREAIRFWRHGRPVEVADFAPDTLLLDYLRLDQRHVGTKEGCAEGDCGACTVALGRFRDGAWRYEPVNACILLLGQVEGAHLLTVEDLAESGALHPV